MIVSELISAILQLFVFTLIPFLIFVISKKSSRGFLQYIGMYQATKKANLLAFLTSLLFVAGGISLVFFNENIKTILTTPPAITGMLKEMGLKPTSILVLLIIAIFKTSLSEEIFFRGFIAKRLINWLGYQTGNLLQAILFGGIHVLLFWVLTKANIFFLSFIFLFSGLAGYSIGYIKEKIGNGSIIPGWIAHGLGNTISYFIIAYVI